MLDFFPSRGEIEALAVGVLVAGEARLALRGAHEQERTAREVDVTGAWIDRGDRDWNLRRERHVARTCIRGNNCLAGKPTSHSGMPLRSRC